MKLPRFTIRDLFWLVLVVGIVPPAASQESEPEIDTADRDAIVIAVLTELFSQPNSRYAKEEGLVAFARISVGGPDRFEDVSDEVKAYFGKRPVVKGASQSGRGKNFNVIDPESGTAAVVFTISSISVSKGSAATVSARTYQNPRGGAIYKVALKKVRGSWRVITSKVTARS